MDYLKVLDLSQLRELPGENMTSLYSTTQANALTIREKALYYALIPVFGN